jgi:hypothetical protein
VRFSVPIRADDHFSIRLEDRRGRRSDLGPFDLRAIPDRPPTMTVLAPAPVEDVARDMTTVILAGATDDHGVKKILLRYRVRQEPERLEVLHEEREGARELAIRYTWALGGYSLLPGEEVEYQVGAVDGNAIDGPQTTWSDARRLRFPRRPRSWRRWRESATRRSRRSRTRSREPASWRRSRKSSRATSGARAS